METGLIKLVENTDEGVEVQCNVGGTENVTAEHYGPPGDDSRPLPGDDAALVGAPGAGNRQSVGYTDGKNASQVANGEVRRYARDAAGTVVCEVWLKGNGDVDIRSIQAGGKVTINGVTIDQDGNITAPGEVTAKSESAPVNLSAHVHPSAVGPTGVPTPSP